MTTLHGDVVNRVKRLPKPAQASEALQPLFEAVSNSFHAIEDAGLEGGVASGLVNISISSLKHPADVTIIVSDNGVGLTPERFFAFCTTDTDFKIDRGGKGIGRLLWLDAFSSIKVKSIFHDEENLRQRSFSFRLENSEQIVDEKIVDVDGFAPTGTTIIFHGIRDNAYSLKFPVKPAIIIKHLGSHFFADFIQGRSPRVIIEIDGTSAQFPNEIQSLKIEDRGTADLTTDDFGILELSSFICHKSASSNFDGIHQLHFIANGRTVTTRKIDGLIGIGRFGQDSDRVYHGCVSGEFLNERVNQERTQFNFDESIVDRIVRECSAHIRNNAIHEEISAFDTHRLGTMRDFVQEYPSFAFEDVENLLERTPKNATKAEQFAQALIPIRIRRDQERNATIQQIVSQISSGENFEEGFAASVKEAAREIKAEEQRQLTEYVMRRKMVLDVLEVLIRRIRDRPDGTQDFHLESTLHQFICPMKVRGDNPTRVEQSNHDLWVIDERLTFTKYFASDVPFSQILENEHSTRRPDLLIYDRLHGLGSGTSDDEPLRRVLLVEFKQPGRREYEERYSPMNQISEYITRLKNGEIEDYRNNRIRIADDCIFYCYVIADIVGKLEIHTNGWRTTMNGRGRIQELGGKFRGVVEVIEWADLLLDARLRNHAFIHAAGLRFDR